MEPLGASSDWALRTFRRILPISTLTSATASRNASASAMAASPETTPLTCRVSPNARRTEITGWTMDEKGRPVLLVKLHAPPVEGAANTELLRFLADVLGCGKSQVTLVRGGTSRLKVVEIPSAALDRLPKRS